MVRSYLIVVHLGVIPGAGLRDGEREKKEGQFQRCICIIQLVCALGPLITREMSLKHPSGVRKGKEFMHGPCSP